MLQSAGVDWEIAVEANGWDLMLHFVELNMGLAVVNECCRIPRGLIARPLPELPSIPYHVFGIPVWPGMVCRSHLREVLLQYGSVWRRS